MRILHLSDYGGPYSGSFVPMLRAASDAARACGHESELVFSGSPAGRAWPAELEAAGLPPRFVPVGDAVAAARAIGRVLAEAPGPALLHCHFSRFDIAAVRAARLRPGTAVVWHVHTTMGTGARLRLRNGARFALFGRDVAAILCVAPHLASEALARLAPGGRVGVLPNAVDTTRFSPPSPAARRAARAALGLPEQAQVLLHFGWDWRLKGGERYVQAARRLAGEGRPVVALTVGGGLPARESAERTGLAGIVRVLEPSEDVRSLYAAADVFVSASGEEGMPYSVAEALACGTSVVASDLPGHALIGGGLSACRLVDPDPAVLAGAIAAQLDRPSQVAAADAAAACARIRERLDLTAWAASLMEHYELAARRPARPVRGAARVAPRPRVVTLVDHLGGHRGGAERIALELALGLAGRGRESVLCASRFTLDEVAKPTVVATLRALRAAEVRFVGLPRRRRWALWDWRELVRELRGRDVVLHAHKFGPNVAAAVIGRLWRVPVVVAHEHSFPPDEGRLRRALTRWVVGRLADVVIAVSDVDRRRLVTEERLPRDRVVHVPNAIPPSRTAGTDVRAELGIPAAAPVAVSVGGLRPVKGFDVLVRAAAELRRALPQLRLLILGYGPGPDVIALRDLVASLGLEDAVAILGSRRDVADCLAAADVAVCSSRWEGSSLSVLEYMQAGKPVVATRVGGNPELLAGGGALLVDPDDPHALAAAIGEVLRDPVRAAAMGALNRRLCRERYAFETMVARVEGLYESRSGRRRGRRTPALARARARVLR